MALNGGVSLAVWMGGCAVELDCARRAHLGPESLAPAKQPDPKAPVRSVYAALCLAFDRELVIDLLSGASAGGVNGALLAAAIQSDTRLHPTFLRERWLELGDFSKLLQKTNRAEPRSVMQGQLFYDEVEKAFKAVLGEEGAEGGDLTELPLDQGSPNSVEPRLDITTTDVLGRERGFLDHWNQRLVAREYRARFRFRNEEHFTSDNLAQAARASSSFPFAFEPWRVVRDARGLAGFKYPRYTIDGGLLDNAPVKAVLNLIPNRPAARQVRRFVCYVNADPPLPEEEEVTDPKEPLVPEVLGYVINLPREAPFVDQLTAIEEAVRRGRFANDTEQALLALDIDVLSATANRLLIPYRRRRRLISLEEQLGEAATADAADRRLSEAQELPWIPTSLATPTTWQEWSWGVRVPERILHLLLDLIRPAIRRGGDEQNRNALLDVRGEIDYLLGRIRTLRADMAANPLIDGGVERLTTDADITSELAGLREAMADYKKPVFEIVRKAAELVYGVSWQLGDLEPGAAVGEALFGADWLKPGALGKARFAHFLRRVLGVEVVRRAFFSDDAVDGGQALHFAQLTPFAPARILTNTPVRKSGPASAEEKLTGLRIGHFAAFYRRSWRANDFMWGRLDAAARVVDLLVEAERAQWLQQSGADLPAPWLVLANALANKRSSTEELWLLHEALVDARDHGSDAIRDALSTYTFAEPPGAEQIAPLLSGALQADLLTPGGDGSFTRIVCTRAAQLEIVREELPIVADESREDKRIGSLTAPVKLPAEGGVRASIEFLRNGKPLPELLGRDDREELASNLAVRTLTHAAFIAVAGLRAARLPLAQLFSIARAPLLPPAGMVSHSPWIRFGVFAGFTAATLFLAGRILTTNEKVDGKVAELFSLPSAVAAIALLAIGGVVLLPLFRAWRGTDTGRRWRDVGWAAALGAGAIATIGLGMWKGKLGWAELIAGPDSIRPSRFASVIVISAVLGIPLLRGVGLPRAVQGALNSILIRPWGGFVSLALIVGAAAFITFTVLEYWGGRLDWNWWELVIGVAAAFSCAACAAILVIRR